ncbi:allophanate hydrolase subunit 1 [Nonomuraea deserti]|uniref:Allophanate hydrolase subunit 1 n=1 Tax=Nonomuraea deserti TaxID=1848322 RepID=A0A4R4UDV2_9ACTN|nr:allophanate hydrolase subunit 1 [Nonomuraea deserti]
MGVRQAGDRAILLELDDAAGVRQVHAELSEDPVEGVADLVPGARTLLVVATRAGDGALAEAVIRARRATASEGEHASPSPVRIPVRYDGEDLPEVAARCGMPVSELIERHSGTLYTAAFLGLAPGFAYLTGLDPALRLPRRDSPRTAVPAGAVAVAGEFTGVYPRATPGGWHLIGTTDVPLWDLGKQPPALIMPGAVVRFEPVR